METYLLAHDLGTSGNKASLVRLNGEIVRSATQGYPMAHPCPGWAEQNPQDWWQAVCSCTRQVLEGIDPASVAGLCLTGQMMCALPVDRQGAPLSPAVLWADGRAEEEARELCACFGDEAFYETVGMRAAANYALPKMMWLRKHMPALYRDTYQFVSPKDYINLCLTGVYAIDPENAAFWHCYDWRLRDWSLPLLHAAQIDPAKLPPIVETAALLGHVLPDAAAACGLAAGTPVIMGPGDGGAATLGASVLEEGEAYLSLGSSSWVCVVSEKKTLDPARRTAKINFLNTCRDSGTMQAGGYAHRWMADTLCQPEQALSKENEQAAPFHKLCDDLAASSPPGAGGVLFQPYLMGERAPLWDMRLRGAFLGLTADTTRADLCRSVLEGVALHLNWIYRCILQSNGMDGVHSMKLVGGGAKSALWSQIFADVFGMPIEITGRPDQAGALGCAVVCGIGLGLYPDYSVLRAFQTVEKVIQPIPEHFALYRELGSILEASASAMKEIHHRLGAL